ncbi:SCO2322 family protein [Streptomyces sp. NPDC048717]|uniref:SCO2322 family protein n=1 Tax=Streptomyces sp. NPDC048717 TaxID=3154928 RepID=UPI003428B4E8
MTRAGAAGAAGAGAGATRTGATLTGAPRALLTVLAAGLLALVSAIAVAAPAQAAGYRYWAFWESGENGWGFATQGPATSRPVDGDSVGFRFAVSANSAAAAKPSTAPDFRAICSGVAEKAGAKRVAVVIDFGTGQDAPSGERPPSPRVRVGCPVLREDASAAEALAEVAKPLRYDANAMLCGIAGYPAKGCGEQVAVNAEKGVKGAKGEKGVKAENAGDAAKSSAAGDGGSSGGPSVGVVAGGAAVLALGAAGVWQARRRRD